MIGNYYIGQIPVNPLIIQVNDQSTGGVLSLGQYDKVEPVMVDERNNLIDLTGYIMSPQGRDGKFTFVFPGDRSVFDDAGDYLLQFKMTTLDGRVDFTNEYTIRVKQLGGK